MLNNSEQINSKELPELPQALSTITAGSKIIFYFPKSNLYIKDFPAKLQLHNFPNIFIVHSSNFTRPFCFPLKL